MANQVSFSVLVDAVANEALKKDLEKYKKAGKEATKQIREDIVNEWFGEFSSSSVNEATQYNVYTKAFDNASIRISIHSYVDVDAYKDKPSAQRWIQRKPIVGNIIDPKEYVLRLQMTEGIIGLPAHATFAPNWTNKGWDHGINLHFHQRPIGLREATFISEKWSEFQSLVDSMV